MTGTAGAGPAPSCPSGVVSLNAGQPVDGNTLQVSHVAGAHAGLAPTWELKYDAFMCNKTASNYAVKSVKLEQLNGASVTSTKTILSSDTVQLINPSLPANTSNSPVMVRDHTQYAYPLPTSVRITVTAASGNTSQDFVRTYAVADQVSPGPVGAFFFPSQQSDLPSGSFWAQGRHAEDITFQRYGLDLGVDRWTGTKWTDRVSGAALDSNKKEDFGSFGIPIYAMSDGEIIGCNRGAADHDAGAASGNVAGGNLLWIRTGNQTQLYAHLKQNTIPYNLCPFTDDSEHKAADPNAEPASDAQFKVKAGQFLGNSGSSGWSLSGPHLHIHTFMGLPKIWGGSETGFDSDSRPMRFINVQVQEKLGNANASSSAWNSVTSSAVMPYNTLISPNACGFLPASAAGKNEVVNAGVPGSCFGEMYNSMVQAGMRPVNIDVHGTGLSSNSTTVWRKADGTSWYLFAGLDAAGLQAKHDSLVVNSGYRYLQLETYVEANQVKYAVILVKGQPGATQYARAGLTDAQHQSIFDTYTASGYRPINMSVAVVNGVRYWADLYEKTNIGNSWVSLGAIKLTDYQSQVDAQVAAGRQPAYLDGYELNGVPYVSAIFENGLTGTFGANHGQTKAQILSLETSNQSSDRYARTMTEYLEAGALKYAAVWRPAPATVIGTKPATGTSTSASFTFSSSTDSSSTFECKLDAGAWAACSSPTAYSSLTKATHTFSVRARDRQGLRDATPATWSWTIN